MKRINDTSVLLAILAVLLTQISALGEVHYSVTDLGTGSGRGVNDSGQVIGDGKAPSIFLYSEGSSVSLPTPGAREACSQGINSSGQACGWYTGSVKTEAFVYSNGVMSMLPTLGGTRCQAYGINNSGQVTGSSSTGGGVSHAFIYSNGIIRDIGTLGGSYSWGGSINNNGDVTGYGYTAGGSRHAFIYSNGTMQDIGTLAGYTLSIGQGINDLKWVTGYSQTANGGSHAFLYSDGVMIDIGTLDGGSSSGYGINNRGQVVGYGYTPRGPIAFLYTDGQMLDLNTLVSSQCGLTLRCAYSISDNGYITGYGTNAAGESHAFLLTPVPEPMTVVLLGIGAIMAGRLRRV